MNEPTINIGVFLLDDDKDMRIMLDHLLKKNNIPDYKIFGHPLEFLKEIGSDISVAVIDHYLGENTYGIDVMKKLLDRNNKCRVIIMSAQTSDEVIIEYWDAGAAGYVKKGTDNFQEKLIFKIRQEIDWFRNLFSFFIRSAKRFENVNNG